MAGESVPQSLLGKGFHLWPPGSVAPGASELGCGVVGGVFLKTDTGCGEGGGGRLVNRL